MFCDRSFYAPIYSLSNIQQHKTTSLFVATQSFGETFLLQNPSHIQTIFSYRNPLTFFLKTVSNSYFGEQQHTFFWGQISQLKLLTFSNRFRINRPQKHFGLREQQHTLSFGEEENTKIAFHLGKKKRKNGLSVREEEHTKIAFHLGKRREKNGLLVGEEEDTKTLHFKTSYHNRTLSFSVFSHTRVMYKRLFTSRVKQL